MKAVVIARARGDLKRESVSAALRSCYPDLVISRKRTGIALAEAFDEAPDEPGERWDEGFSDVGHFIEEHQPEVDYAGDNEPFPESEVAEVLAATWKEKRQELNRLQKTRQFQKAKDVKRSFRVEIEEMKRNSTCNKCGRKGHWARERRSKDGKGTSKGRGTSSSSAPSGAAAVHELEQLRGAGRPLLHGFGLIGLQAEYLAELINSLVLREAFVQDAPKDIIAALLLIALRVDALNSFQHFATQQCVDISSIGTFSQFIQCQQFVLHPLLPPLVLTTVLGLTREKSEPSEVDEDACARTFT